MPGTAKDPKNQTGDDAGTQSKTTETQGQQQAAGSTAEPKTFDEEYVKQLREENKDRRLKGKALEEELNSLKQQQTDFQAKVKKLFGSGEDDDQDVDKLLTAEREKAQATERQAKQALLKANFIAAATAKNFNDPEKAFKLLDADDIEVDLEKGTVSGVTEAVDKMVEESPWLAKASDAGGQETKTTPDLKTGGGNPSQEATGSGSHTEALKAIMEEAKKIKDPERASAFIFEEKRKLGIGVKQQ